jgi:hypothetical protein
MMDDEFFLMIEDFVKSSKELADAAALCYDDPIKQDMVGFVHEEFDSIQARSEGIKLLITKDYKENRDFILEEMRNIIGSSRNVATQIRDILRGL